MTLSEYRKKNDLTYRKLAAMIGVCPATVWQICQGKQPNLSTAKRIIAATTLTMEDLLK